MCLNQVQIRVNRPQSDPQSSDPVIPNKIAQINHAYVYFIIWLEVTPTHLEKMPPKKGKAKKEPKEGDLSKETIKKLEAFDKEEFHEKSAVHVRLTDSLGMLPLVYLYGNWFLIGYI